MPHFKVSDDSHSHPKAIMAGDAAWGMWNRAGCWSMAYGTDGFVPEWWVKQQPQGTVKAKALIGAQLWRRGEYEGDRPEYQGQKGYTFHEWRQDSYEKVEADRAKWRDKKANQRGSVPRVSPGDKRGDNTGDTRGDSRESPGYIPNTQYPKNSGEPKSVSPDSTEREPRSAPVTPLANRLVSQIIPSEHPPATLTELRLQTSALLKAGQPEALVAQALELWTTKALHPKTLPSLVSELINGRSSPVPGAVRPVQSTSDQRVAQVQALKNSTTNRLELT
ncbi:hypothetical protein [Mycobacteroides abscessus]|uniref:hypothetical protein n=1 Tax=Mycobacteroides abscessus TaxID=36809 RepID=UPI0009D2DEDA|nr:hypothetical protein [Mycobacteroides abscessus]MDO3363985.1 hypothetical protein [Mycobacteroides abscessus subsp. massiliense]SKI16603.1 Uncharacterised protein [Mycobacteroides abscessus subsp. massiliense]SKN83956.1 Uncharacterised protein [Mycobacteroides abscessus subsp. massiliense]SKP88580.1 Uncharacterised protein [Mycobacteroides abscessus subsp. massiliense]